MQQTQTATDDLNWLYDHAEADLGVKSNFSALLLASKVGTKRTHIDEEGQRASVSLQDFETQETRLIDILDTKRGLSRRAASRKMTRVMRAFERLSPQHKAVLEAWHYAKQWPIQLSQFFGDAVCVLPLCPSSEGQPVTDQRWLLSIVVHNDRIAHILREEANTLYKSALKAFEALR